jgi:two-component system OmpR family response regulator
MSDILIVDDEPQVRRTVSRIFEKAGIACEAVSTIREARAAVAAHMPAAMLLDVSVGSESGLALHAELRRADPLYPAVIFITGRRDLFQQLASGAGPFDDWIIKPWDPAELVARVRLVLRRQEIAGQASPEVR